MEEQGIDYAVAVDVGSNTTSAFAVDSYPDYYLIDRAGKLRVADLKNSDLERAVALLLAEAPAVAPVLAQASASATKKDKRILVLWGSEGERAAVDGILKAKGLRTLVRNEYEVVRMQRAANADLVKAHQAGSAGAALAVLDAGGSLLGRMDATAVEAHALTEFLERNRVPVKDAEVIWSEALAEAQRLKKNLLVHLGAPW